MPTPRTTPPPDIAWGPLALVAVVTLAVLELFSTRYGFHRDELYFIAAGHHPAWGYPDQPPLTPLVAALMDDVGHGSLVVLRLPAALAAAAVAVLTGLCARELGGGRFAQTLAAATMAASTYVLVSGHLLVTSTLDLLAWVTLTWLVVRLLAGADPRWWLGVGVVAGLGLLNKQLPVVLLAGLLVGALLTPSARGLLRSPWPWAAVLIAAAMWAPVLVWQAQHDWPQLTLAGQIRDEYGTPGQRAAFIGLQFVIFSIGATYLWIRGLIGLWRDPAWRVFRVLAWAWLFVFGFFVVTAGQPYYSSGVYPALVAAGAVVVERGRCRWVPVAVVVATSAVMLPAALPLLPAGTFGNSFYAALVDPLLDTVGWPELVDQVAAAYGTIPADSRERAVVVTSNYGEAGAVDRLGPSRGLPHAWSGHNGYGLWGPPPEGSAPVVVVWQDGPPTEFFRGCREVGPVTNKDGVENEESERTAVYVCDGPLGDWSTVWPHLVHLSS